MSDSEEEVVLFTGRGAPTGKQRAPSPEHSSDEANGGARLSNSESDDEEKVLFTGRGVPKGKQRAYSAEHSGDEAGDGVQLYEQGDSRFEQSEEPQMMDWQSLSDSSVVTVKAEKSTSDAATQTPAKRIGPALPSLSGISLHEKFTKEFDLDTVFFRDMPKFRWRGREHNYSGGRVDWIDANLEYIRLWENEWSTALIMECFDPLDLGSSPMFYSAIRAGEIYEFMGGFCEFLFGPGVSHLTPANCLLYLISRFIWRGSEHAMPDSTLDYKTLLLRAVVEQLEKSSVTIALVSLSDLEHDEATIAEWVAVCRELIELTKMSTKDLEWDFKFLIINTERSAIVEQLKTAYPAIPVLQCPTGPEFKTLYPSGKMPRVKRGGWVGKRKARKAKVVDSSGGD